jgi:hypothetical protein
MLWGCAIVVLMLNEAAVPPSVLARAQMDAARIYRGVGVNLVWIHEAGEHREYDFTMKIVRAALSPKEVDAAALGVAPAPAGARGNIAYAFYRRIGDFAATHRVEIGPILGSVIAHELGHLLLAQGSHSRTGLMSSNWDVHRAQQAAMGLLTFSGTAFGNSSCRDDRNAPALAHALPNPNPKSPIPYP